MLAINPRTPRGVRQAALSLATIASKLAPTGAWLAGDGDLEGAFASKPAPTGSDLRQIPWPARSPVGAGLPAKAALSLAAPMKTPWPASRLLQVRIRVKSPGGAVPCRSWLASEGGLEPCRANEDAFASKPAPTGSDSHQIPWPARSPVGAGLPAKAALSLAAPMKAPSPASRLLQVRICVKSRGRRDPL